MKIIMATQRRWLDSGVLGDSAATARSDVAVRATVGASSLSAHFHCHSSWQIKLVFVNISFVELTVSWVLGEESSLRTNRDLPFAFVAT